MGDTTNFDSSLDEILKGLYGDTQGTGDPAPTGNTAPEEETSGKDAETGTAADEGNTVPDTENGTDEATVVEKAEKNEADMTDEELSLAVEVDLPPESEPENDDGNAAHAAEDKPQRTAEDVKKIRETAQSDVLALRGAFPELRRIKSLAELPDPAGFLKYRKRGMTPEEAYQLINYGKAAAGTAAPVQRTRQIASSGAGAPPPKGLTSRELEEARIFLPGLTDEEYNKYYHPLKN